MKRDGSHPARWGIILVILFILMVAGAYTGLIFSLFKPYYRVTINDIFIGYYQNQEEYQKIYDKITNEKYENNYEVTKSFSNEPCFEKVYAKPKYVEQFNNYILITENISKEYAIYKIIVNNEIQMYTKTNERAEQIVTTIKEKVKNSTEIKIEKELMKDLNNIQIAEETEELQQKVINANKTVTSRSGSTVRALGNKGFMWPTPTTYITSNYGARWGKTHTGIDIGVATGIEIVASRAGKVIYSGWCGNYGYYVKIDHGNGIVTAYAHNSKLLVSVGEQVAQGQAIACSGSTGYSTGPHCHFEIIINGQFKNPLNYL